ncbi:hypothetical protein BUALT_Bualt16G0027500 [Buddleja alternifolia]|uniref:Retrovirus-related Pol polyprotein from transposon TNT 1-94-like beta-barrel domain-containing protein n=1 Tax=Buddleja alternifolia TaxID=168488 RepID=A0AAV6WGA1_9LAMI|nr:hypothetical protein BUALT_Bualt16G0027500 [Buddleja alternifolia]
MFGNMLKAKIIGIGDVHIQMNIGCTLMLKDVCHVSDLRFHLISGIALDHLGYASCFGNGKWKLTRGSMVVARGAFCGGLYKTCAKVCFAGLTTTKDESLSDMWHMRLSQCGEIKLESLAKKSLIPFAKGVSLISCDIDMQNVFFFFCLVDEKVECFHPRICECNEFAHKQRKDFDGEVVSCIFLEYKRLGVKSLWDVNQKILRCRDVLNTVEPRVSVPDLAPSSPLLKVCPVKGDCQKDVLEACNISDVLLPRDVEQGELSPLPGIVVEFGEFVAVEPCPGTLLINFGDVSTDFDYYVLVRILITTFLLGPKKKVVEAPPELVAPENPPLYIPFKLEDFRNTRFYRHMNAGEALDVFRVES